MRKVLFLLSFLASVTLLTSNVSAATYWDISGEKDITYYLGLSTYTHHYTIIQDSNGDLSGTGYYVPNNAYTEAIVDGSVIGDAITMNIAYTGLNPSYKLTVYGTIAVDGSVTGTADSNTGQHFTWSWPKATTIWVDTDPDNDGVEGDNDYCADTQYDEPSDGLGTNRWIYTANGWETKLPKGNGPKDTYTIETTYGCSCDQILARLEEATGEEFEGHHKFGCSKSILEAWIEGSYYVGPTWVETVEVPANEPSVTSSINPLTSGVTYFLTARGTANAGDGIEFDARYSFRTPTSTEWTDAVSNYESYGTTLLDLFFNGSTPWGDYNPLHEYEYETIGDGNLAEFQIYDVYYPNNTGSLFVDIVEDKWVTLW